MSDQRLSLAGDVRDVLFLCTGNSARSIIAEALLRHFSGGRFQAFSAGSQPKAEPHPVAISILNEMKISTPNLRSKRWDEFHQSDSPKLDFVFTVCDRIAGEMCPVWPGQQISAQWSIDDPASVSGDAEQRDAFMRVYKTLEARIKLFTSLHLRSLDRLRLQAELQAIGQYTVGKAMES